jgi:hypothetical protein
MVRPIAFTACLLLAANAATAQSLQQSPTGPPPAVAPHPINAPAPADPILLQKLELLRARIGQRDQLQREIDQLIVETQTPQQMVIHLELLEVNRTMAEKLGIGSKKRDPSASVVEVQPWTMAELDELRRQGAVETLASPKLQVTSGQLATSQIGVADANSELNGVDSPFTDISVRADSLGNNQVRVDFRVDRASPSEADKSNRDPALRARRISIESRMGSTFGDTQMFGGMTSQRTRTRRGALGRVTETVYLETVLLIRAEAVMPRTAGIIPAAAITPR